MRLCTKNIMLDVRGEESFSFYDYKLVAVAVRTSLQQYGIFISLFCAVPCTFILELSPPMYLSPQFSCDKHIGGFYASCRYIDRGIIQC